MMKAIFYVFTFTRSHLPFGGQAAAVTERYVRHLGDELASIMSEFRRLCVALEHENR